MPSLQRLTPLLLFLAVGCTRYEYEIVEPAEFAGHVGKKTPAAIELDPVRYEAVTRNGRLVLVIHNESDQPLKLLGDDSFAVDPRGESHPLPTRTIAPDSTTKLIFPPVRPTLRRSSGATLGIGVGLGSRSYRRGYGRYGFAGDPWYYDDYPRHYRLEDDGTVYWDWPGDGTSIRVRLVYQLGEKTFHHDFTFRRVKV